MGKNSKKVKNLKQVIQKALQNGTAQTLQAMMIYALARL